MNVALTLDHSIMFNYDSIGEADIENWELAQFPIIMATTRRSRAAAQQLIIIAASRRCCAAALPRPPRSGGEADENGNHQGVYKPPCQVNLLFVGSVYHAPVPNSKNRVF